MKHLKTTYFVVFLLLFVVGASNFVVAQTTLEACQEMARKNYPAIKRFDLIEKSKRLSLSNATKNYLPQLMLTARGTYQSDVISLPSGMPVNIPTLNKEQYQIGGELSQLLWDGGTTSAVKGGIEAEANREVKALEVELYSIVGRIDQLYFGIMALELQKEKIELFVKELEASKKRVATLVENGVANGADLNAVEVAQLKALQGLSQINTSITTYREMLSLFTGDPSIKESVLIAPQKPSLQNRENNRPEIQLFGSSIAAVEAQRKINRASLNPKFSLFLQGGYGDPGLNMLKPGGTSYYITGIRAAWNIGSFYTHKSKNRVLELKSKEISANMESFLFNSSLNTTRVSGEIDKLEKSIALDNQIVELRKSLVETTQVRLENGTANINDLLRELTEHSSSTIERELHKLELIIAHYQLKEINNY